MGSSYKQCHLHWKIRSVTFHALLALTQTVPKLRAYCQINFINRFSGRGEWMWQFHTLCQLPPPSPINRLLWHCTFGCHWAITLSSALKYYRGFRLRICTKAQNEYMLPSPTTSLFPSDNHSILPLCAELGRTSMSALTAIMIVSKRFPHWYCI